MMKIGCHSAAEIEIGCVEPTRLFLGLRMQVIIKIMTLYVLTNGNGTENFYTILINERLVLDSDPTILKVHNKFNAMKREIENLRHILRFGQMKNVGTVRIERVFLMFCRTREIRIVQSTRRCHFLKLVEVNPVDT